MTNLDYEHRMNALNQLIHETLGVSLNTVTAAYGQARCSNINAKSTSDETGRLPLSSARLRALADLASFDESADASYPGATVFDDVDAPDITERSYSMLGTMPESSRLPFLVQFRRASSSDGYLPHRREALPVAIFSKQPSDYANSASDCA